MLLSEKKNASVDNDIKDQQQLMCITATAAIYILRVLFNGQGSRNSGLWKLIYATKYTNRNNLNQRIRGLDLQTSISQYGAAYLPSQFISRTTTIPTFRVHFANTLGFIRKSYIWHGLNLQIHKNREGWDLYRLAILRNLLTTSRSWEDYSLAITTAAQLCVQAYIKQVFNTLYERSVHSSKSPTLRRGEKQKTLSQFLTGLSSDEQAGVMGLDLPMIENIFLNNDNPPTGTMPFNPSINASASRTTNNAGSWKGLCDPTIYVNAFRPIFENPSLFETKTTMLNSGQLKKLRSRWDGWNETTKFPTWPLSKFRRFLIDVYNVLETSIPGPDVQENPGYVAFERTGGFPTFVCTQAAKSVWIIRAYETSDANSIVKVQTSKHSERNDTINKIPAMKRARFWTMTPPSEAIRLRNYLNKTPSDELSCSWREATTISHNIHDQLYFSSLNSATDLHFPKSYISTTTKDNSSLALSSLPAGWTKTELQYLFHWRTLPFAKMMEQTVEHWTQEIMEKDIELDRAIDDYIESSDSENGPEDDDIISIHDDEDDDEDVHNLDAPVTLTKWKDQFITAVETHFQELCQEHATYATKYPHTVRTLTSETNAHAKLYRIKQEPDQTLWSKGTALAKNNTLQLGHLSNLTIDRNTTIQTQTLHKHHISNVPYTVLPWQYPLIKLRRDDISIENSDWDLLAKDLRCKSRLFCIGGPGDIIRNAKPLISSMQVTGDRKGWARKTNVKRKRPY
jgi:hypothetical protein